MTAFFVVMLASLLLCGGLVLDGGLALRAKVQAIDEAQEAARAGAQQLNLDTYRRTGALTLDPQAAARAAEAYLQATGNPLAAQANIAVTDTQVSVTVERRQPTQLLTLIGLGSLTVHGSGSAVADLGITGPQQP